jgi:hypothetical protein
MSPIGYARTAGVLFAAEAIFPIAHRLTGSAYNGFSHVHDVVVDAGLTVVWVTAALVSFLGKPSNGPAFLLAGASVSVVHGVMFSIATSDRGPVGAGIPFLAAAAVQFYLTAHAFPAFAQRSERREAAESREAEAPPRWHLGRVWLRPRHSH